MIRAARFGKSKMRQRGCRPFAPAKLWKVCWQATAVLERFTEIVGAAVKRLPMDLRAGYPSVPWKEIAGTRDHLSHGYDDVDYQVLWDAMEKDVPDLLATVEKMLKDLG